MEKERDSFVFYKSFFEAIDKMPKDEQLEIYRAIVRYGLFQEEPSLEGIASIIWAMAKPQLDANWKRYINGCKGAEFGSLGGHAKGYGIGNQNARKNPKTTPNQKQNEPQNEPQTNPKRTPNDNVNDNDNVNVCDINTHAHAQAPEGAEGVVKEYYDFVNWVVRQYPDYYGNTNRVTMVTDIQYSRLRRSYSKAQIVRAMEELGANQQAIEQHRYNNLFVALRNYLEYVPRK